MSTILRGLGAGTQSYVVSGTADRVAVFDSNGELAAADTTSSQLSYLDNTQALTEVTMLDDQSTAVTFISYESASFPFTVIEYSIERDIENREFGVLRVTSNSTDVNFSQERVSLPSVDAVGVTISATVNNGEVRLQYATTSSGNDAKCNFIIRKWNEVE